jgi:mevalonate kinase
MLYFTSQENNMSDLKITASELDEMLESEIMEGDQSILDRQQKQIMTALEGSKRCRMAMEGVIQHITQNGPDHVSCGIATSAAIFIILGMKLAEHRQKTKASIDELTRMFGLEGAPQ